MATIDQQFIEYIVKALADKPDEVRVERTVDDRGVLLTLHTSPDDTGRVIGKKGITAQSLRTLLRALGTKNSAHYNLKIDSLDNPAPSAPRTESPAKQAPEVEVESAPAAETTPEAPSAEEPAVPEVKVEASAEIPQDEVAAPAQEPEVSDLAAKTRADLAELDDLDI